MDWLPPQVPVYAWDGASNVFIVDDRGWDYSASGNAMFAAPAQSGGLGAMESSGPPTARRHQLRQHELRRRYQHADGEIHDE